MELILKPNSYDQLEEGPAAAILFEGWTFVEFACWCLS
jgi:hypothetical protein